MGKNLIKLFEEVLKESHLKEQLISAQMKDLDAAMNIDSSLSKLMTTPAEELPIEYRNLVEEIAPNMIDKDLYFFIKTSIENGLVSLFSRSSDGSLEAFISYRVRGNEIKGIKMFSINPHHKDFTFQRDFDYLLSNVLLPKYKRVEWSALAKNSANKTYRRIIRKNGGNCNPPIKDHKNIPENTIIHYWIDSN
jgi:hypothetical protein